METLRLRVYRILCLMMALMILISAAVLPSARAVVLADDLIAAGAVGIVAAIWIASGAEFSSTADLWSACQYVYDNYISNVPELLSEVTQLARQWAWTWGGAVGKVGVLVSSALWDAVCGTPSTDTNLNYVYYDTITVTSDNYEGYATYLNNSMCNLLLINGNVWRVYCKDGYLYWLLNGQDYNYYSCKGTQARLVFAAYPGSKYCFEIIAQSLYESGSTASSPHGYLSYKLDDMPLTISLGYNMTISGTIAEPQDIAVTLPQATPGYDDEGKVVMPDVPLDAGSYRTNTADIPTDAALPTDTVIDLTTGAEITEATDVPDVPATGELPSASDLTLPDLIISKFPFCIPFDVYNMFALLAADPVEPVFVIPVQIGSLVDETITIDFSQFSQIIAIVRWGEYACFVAGLALVTRNYIKW